MSCSAGWGIVWLGMVKTKIKRQAPATKL